MDMESTRAESSGCEQASRSAALPDFLTRAAPRCDLGPKADRLPAFVVKDNFDVAGWPTTAGSAALVDQPIAPRNAEVVQRLIGGGYHLLGRSTMHELAFGVTGVNDYAGTPINPCYPSLIPGGSSSGSAAAVAAGFVNLAIGTDTGGSVRIPAACCGVVGLKPTFGRVSRQGVVPASSSLDCVGLFARNVETIEQAMALLVDDWAETKGQYQPLVAAIDRPCDPAIAELVRDAAASRCDVTDLQLDLFDDAFDAGLILIGLEAWQAFGSLTEVGGLGADVRERLLSASRVTEAERDAAESVRELFRAELDAALLRFDALVLPTVPCPIPTLAESDDARSIIPITRLARPFNLSGHPAISLPIGEIAGRPVSLQLVGRRGGDEQLCAIARRFAIFNHGGVLWTQ